jgi:NAD(P)-dependent dehydrogenase (short-subunit alcohol dehydrogenase family)
MAEKIALITGANKGIGLETARQLGAMGITVLVGARDAAKGEQAVATLKAEGITAYPVTIDVTDPASVAAAAGKVEAQFSRLDILVNNAGVLSDGGVSASTVSDAIVRQTFETNVFGLINTTQAFCRFSGSRTRAASSTFPASSGRSRSPPTRPRRSAAGPERAASMRLQGGGQHVHDPSGR